MSKYIKALGFIVLCELAGAIGSIFTASAIPTWYATLAKPALNPPAWIFGPVWTTLYALMGIAAFLVWRKRDSRSANIGLWIFAVQIALNIFWSVIFFGWHSQGGAFIEVIFLWLSIAATIALFARVSKPAAWLLVPYLAWVSFAGFLNYSIWQLNSGSVIDQVSCTQEAKLCPDGSYVGRTGPKCEFSACPNEDSAI